MAYRVAILPLEEEARADQAPVGLEEVAKEIPGIRDVAIDPIGETVRLVYDDEVADILDVTRVLAQYGYPVGTPITTEGEL